MTDWFALLSDPDSLGEPLDEPESLVARSARIDGVEVILMACDFEFAAGTLSIAAGAAFSRAVDAAIEGGVALVAVARSGGARMQQGTRAFVQMLKSMEAVARLRGAGLPFIVYLADPTTGGVLASWASAAHVTFAEPDATVAFTGPRVADALGMRIDPPEVQRAQSLLENGHVDAVVAISELRGAVRSVLVALSPGATPEGVVDPDETVVGPMGWQAVLAARSAASEPVIEELLRRADEVVELNGDRAGGRSESIIAAVCRLDGRPLMLIGHRRDLRPVGAAGLRVARRAMTIASELGLAVVTVIDTEGAEISAAEEQAGLAGAISSSIATMLAVRVPTLAVLAGSGCGGAAVAWAGADRLIAIPAAWLAPISPEAAAAIVHRDAGRASEMADLQQVGAIELRTQGIVDRVVPPDRIVDAISSTLDRLASTPLEELLAARSERFRCIAG